MELEEMPSVSGAKGEDLEASKELQEVKGDDKENLDKKTKGLKGMQTLKKYINITWYSIFLTGLTFKNGKK